MNELVFCYKRKKYYLCNNDRDKGNQLLSHIKSSRIEILINSHETLKN